MTATACLDLCFERRCAFNDSRHLDIRLGIRDRERFGVNVQVVSFDIGELIEDIRGKGDIASHSGSETLIDTRGCGVPHDQGVFFKIFDNNRV